MTKTELTTILKMLSTNYAKTIDNTLINLWYDFFKDFKLKIFQNTCQKIMSTNDYFPRVSEVIAVYKQIQDAKRAEEYEKLKMSNRLLAQNQDDCYLCENTGFCLYKRGEYEFVARCICAHGKDLNKFSKAQIDKDTPPKDPKSGKVYLATIQEVLGDDFPVFEAQKKSKKISGKNLSEEEQLKILNQAINY